MITPRNDAHAQGNFAACRQEAERYARQMFAQALDECADEGNPITSFSNPLFIRHAALTLLLHACQLCMNNIERPCLFSAIRRERDTGSSFP